MDNQGALGIIETPGTADGCYVWKVAHGSAVDLEGCSDLLCMVWNSRMCYVLRPAPFTPQCEQQLA
jgi:hypothetical protein